MAICGLNLNWRILYSKKSKKSVEALKDNNVSMLTHIHTLTNPEIKVVIYNHQAEYPVYSWSDDWLGDLQAQEWIWPYMTLTDLIETRCHRIT